MKSDMNDSPSSRTAMTPLAIIGLGCLFPKADNPEAYWANIRDRVDCVTDIPPTHWNPDDYYDPDKKARDKVYAKRGGFLNTVAIDPMESGIAPRDIEATDTTQLLGLLAVKQALMDAGYGPDSDFDRENTSVILGVTGALEMVIPLGARLGHPIWRKALEEAGVDPATADDVVQRISGSYVEWQENSFPGLLGNVTAGRIANRFDLGGTNCVVDAACASSLGALHLAALELSSGRSNMVIAGGADTFNDIFMYTCFSKTPAISPTGNARPFDAAGDGTILGEGLGMIVLKRLEDAERDGDRIYAVVRAVGSSSDGKGNAVYAPSSKGQVKAIRRAYEQAGIRPETIELIEAHGTGTVVGDGIELEALLEVYGDSDRQPPWCALGSIKSQIGHTKAAAGSAGLIKTALALKHKTLPPIIKIERPLGPLQENGSPFYLNARPRPWMPSTGHPRRAALSSFGFGGSNFHLVVEEYRPEKEDIDWDDRVLIVAFSGKDRRDLQDRLSRFPNTDDWPAIRAFASQSTADFSHREPCRLLLVIEKETTDISRLKEACRDRLEKDDAVWTLPDGAWFGSGDKPGKLALLFPGQGAQYVGMFRDVACRLPQMFQVLAAADKAFSDREGEPPAKGICDFIYPVHDITDEDLGRAEEELKNTRVAQPAIGAVALGLYRVLEYFGLEADLAAGHSYGELVALCASGRYDESDLHHLSRLRGSLMAKTNGRQGSMLAVRTDAEQAGSLIERHNLGDLVVANKNAPQQTVLSGGVEDIEKAAGIFKEAGIHSVRLKVSNAFHSHLMNQAKGPFQDALGRVRFASASMPVYANSTAAPYPTAETESREILAAQLVRPVEFIDQIVNMYRTGVGTFLEVGPGKSLTGLVGSILKDKPVFTVPVDASKGARSSMVDLARTLAHLSALGYGLDLAKWDGAFREIPRESSSSKFTVPICGANRFEKKERPPVSKPDTPATAIGEAQQARTVSNPPNPGMPVTRPTTYLDRNIQETIVKKEIQSPIPPSPASPVDAGALREALRLTQDNIQTLQRMQTQTADLHHRFLTGQETAQQSLQDLIRQQQYLLEKSFGDGHVAAMPQTAPVRPPAPAPTIETAAPSPQAPEAPPETVPATLEPEPEPVRPIEETGAGPDSESIMAVLIEVVSANTGYPPEMLSPDMSLDADLGIDSIKRVEILSSLAERLPDLPAAGPDEVGKLRTLREVADFLSRRPEVVPEPEASPTTSSSVDKDLIIQTLLQAVSQHTGYPIEMLELDMKLDADLGIDSIKRVEILSALAETMPDLPVVEPDQAGRLQTLREVAGFLSSTEAPSSPTVAEEAVVEKTFHQEAPIDASIWEAVCRAVEKLAGYSSDNLEPGLRLEEDLGVDPVRLVALFEAVGGILGLNPEQPPLSALETLGCLTRYFSGHRQPQAGATLCEEPAIPSGAIDRYVVEPRLLSGNQPDDQPALPKGARVWVTDDASGLSQAIVRRLAEKGIEAEVLQWESWEEKAVPADLAGLIVVSPPAEIDDHFYLSAFRLTRKTGSVLRRNGDGPAVFATVTRLDGRFGLSGERVDFNPKSGGLAGLAKTVHHEWPELVSTAFDVDMAEPDIEVAAREIVAELPVRGPMEVGLSGGLKWTPVIRAEPLAAADDTVRLSPEDVVLVSGGARGVTAEAALALARKWRPTLILLGRTPLPDDEPGRLAGLADEASIKKELFGRAPAGTTPAQIERQYRGIASAREIRENLKRMREAGSRVVYLPVDVTDRDAVTMAVSNIRRDYGPVKGLVHGAGILADRLIPDKTPEQFAAVYHTKVSGLSALLEAAQDDPVEFMVFFSSSTGRFGRGGQVDYAVANEILNKTAQREAVIRHGCRVLSFNWGPWAGGMVNPSLEKVFKNEGLTTIPLVAGAEYMVREIASNRGGPVEIVVLGPGSRLPEEVTPADALASGDTIVVERTLSLDRTPVLKSHVIGGQAVLPMALMIEWMARAGSKNSLGGRFIGLNRLDVHRRLTLEAQGQIDLFLTAEPAASNGPFVSNKVRLEAGNGLESIPYAECEILASNEFDLGSPALPDITTDGYPHNGRFYEGGRLFHGPDLRGVVNIDGFEESGIGGRIKTSPPVSSWLPEDNESGWLTDPLALDSVFQMVILWCWEQHGLPALPVRVGRYRQSEHGYPSNSEVRAAVRIIKNTGPTIEADIEITDLEGRLLARLEDVVCFESESLIEAYRQNRLEDSIPPAGTAVQFDERRFWPIDRRS